MATLDFILATTAIMDNATGHFAAIYSNSRAVSCRLGLEALPLLLLSAKVSALNLGHSRMPANFHIESKADMERNV
jgi:hypothetical protein